MSRPWTPPWSWVFLVATILGVFSTLQAIRLASVSLSRGPTPPWWQFAVLNFAYWYVPALVAPRIVRLSQRRPFGAQRWALLLAIHAGGALSLSILHLAGTTAARMITMLSAPGWNFLTATYLQRQYLMDLDWNLMTYAALVGLGHAVRYHGDSRERALRAARLETELVSAQLRTLQAELQPHFLFNTLHAISTLVHRDPEAADRMISRLSDLLRLGFARGLAQQVPLHEEIEFLRKYLEIEQVRFQDRLRVHFDVASEALDVPVPPLILQPIVENAVRHGIAPRVGPGTVEVLVRLEHGRLRLVVRDDGVGLSGVTHQTLENGVGLTNTRARLEYLYGDDFALSFGGGGRGVSLTLDLPLRPTLDRSSGSGQPGPRRAD